MRVEDQKGMEQDTVATAKAIESMYGVIVVLKLQPAGGQSHYTWRVYAVAYLGEEQIPTNGALQRGVSYPSPHHKTFAGAALRALHDLEEALQALWHLKGLRID